MRGETIILQPPPTPPEAGTKYRPKMQQTAPYNATRKCPSSETGQNPMRMGAHEVAPPYWSEPGPHLKTEFGLGVQFDGYNQSADYYQDGEYHGLPGNQGLFGPLTPRSTIEDDAVRRTTRNGRAPAPSCSPRNKEQSPRPKAIPRSRKPKAEKSEKAKAPKLPVPLSKLKIGDGDIPIKNMEEWVNRSAEIRRIEVEKRNGYITRPMNSFMLYRSAYAEIAKAWCLQNNHQVVSSVAGESWPMEEPSVRNRYNEYARIERINHHLAHPSYKFSPSKTPVPARRRKGEWSDDEEPSDLEESEWPASRDTSRSRKAPRLDRSLSCPNNGLGVEFFDHAYTPNMNRTSWHIPNDARPIATPIGQSDVCSQYYQSPMYSVAMGQGFTDDVHVRKVSTPAPVADFQTSQALLALPSGNAGSMGYSLPLHTRGPFEEEQLDPMLLAFDGSSYSHVNPATLHAHEFGHGRPVKFDEETKHYNLENISELHHPHYEYHAGFWQSDQAMAPLEQELEFDKWMGEH